MFINNLVWINNNLDSTKAPMYLSLCKHREIYNGAFVLLRSKRIQERSAKWSSDWMKVTIVYTKQHRCDECVTMIRILLLSRAEKGRMLWECLFYIVLFFYIAIRPCAKCEDTSLRWRINAPVASLNAPPPSRFSNENLASARMRHTSDIPNVWTKVILQKRSGTLLIFQTCRRKAGLRTAHL